MYRFIPFNFQPELCSEAIIKTEMETWNTESGSHEVFQRNFLRKG